MTIQEKIEAIFCLKGEDAEAIEELIREIVRDEFDKKLELEIEENLNRIFSRDEEVPF